MAASPYLGEFLALAGVHFLAVMSPGPDFAVAVSQSVRHGRKTGVLTALGIGSGISVHVLYALLGIGVLLHTWPWINLAVRCLGGVYLVYLGIKLLRAQPASSLMQTGQAPVLTMASRKAFMTGFLTNATNPKAMLFFLAIFTTIVSARTPLRIQIGYGIWMCCVTAIWFCLVSFLFSTARVRQRFERLGHWFERVMGGLLLLFAVRLFIWIIHADH
ncbi:MAG: LysE family transporter [Burkholderiaceae bacterium]|jgi:RhtB (resistance to homoserine/threonine) family protein|nr:LysE family transporter [Burkholderiaceae bacterium]